MALECTPPVILNAIDQEAIAKSKLLVIGAGGIGCEILKNLALSGFKDVEIVDMDTIDVSNLNRQFLFHKEHVGQSKAIVARDSILYSNATMNITAHHASINEPKFGINFFNKFDVVLNALDNRAARNHVNRMCLAADVPLIESGTAGYSGQAEFIRKGKTACYECQPKPRQKTFPGCTIRNTPSEPVHCIIWAKHLFNQLFGEATEEDDDVSPDASDPAAAGAGSIADQKNQNGTQKLSTRQWAITNNYEASTIFNKLFEDDILYLLTMDNLWKTRKAPEPTSWTDAIKDGKDKSAASDVMSDMQVWSLQKCAQVFADSIAQLQKDLKGKTGLIWDKDDKPSMDFVSACANIRCCIFGITPKSRFETKSIAGNIIPAIASTNAMVAGLVVLMAMRVLAKKEDDCQSIYVRQKSVVSSTLLMADRHLEAPNPNCYVCSPNPLVNVYLNIPIMTVDEFVTEVLKKGLGITAPDVINMTRNTVMISSEEGETDGSKTLKEMFVADGSMLNVEDFMQNYTLTVCLHQWEGTERDDPLFKIATDAKLPNAEGDTNGTKNGNEESAAGGDQMDSTGVGKSDEGADDGKDDPLEGPSKRRKIDEVADDDDDDCMIMSEEDD